MAIFKSYVELPEGTKQHKKKIKGNFSVVAAKSEFEGPEMELLYHKRHFCFKFPYISLI